jgi:hypothetical protein
VMEAHHAERDDYDEDYALSKKVSKDFDIA